MRVSFREMWSPYVGVGVNSWIHVGTYNSFVKNEILVPLCANIAICMFKKIPCLLLESMRIYRVKGENQLNMMNVHWQKRFIQNLRIIELFFPRGDGYGYIKDESCYPGYMNKPKK